MNRALATIKTAMAWGVEQSRIHSNPAAPVRLVPDSRPGPRALDRRELGALLREARRAGSVRDACLITFLAQTGLRIGEALALTWDDVVLRERSGAVTVRAGKGGRRREVPLTLTARRALTDWQAVLQNEGRGSPWIFAGHQATWPITARAFEAALGGYSRRAGLERHVTPHALRHTFCKGLVDAGVSLDRVAALAGHASLSTTARYTTPTVADLEQAVEELEWV